MLRADRVLLGGDPANFCLICHSNVSKMVHLGKALDLGAAAGLQAIGLITQGQTVQAVFCKLAGRTNSKWGNSQSVSGLHVPGNLSDTYPLFHSS